jgi:GNAT superfamily N-acetyltransferase
MIEDRVAPDISIAETDMEILSTHDLIGQLHPPIQQISPEDYLERVRLQQAELGYQVAVLREEGQIRCVAGFRFCRSLGWGRFLYVDDLVTDERYRSHGAGKIMFAWLVEKARDAQCDLRLDCAVFRREAHRFYLRERMDIFAFHFRLAINKLEQDQCPPPV